MIQKGLSLALALCLAAAGPGDLFCECAGSELDSAVPVGYYRRVTEARLDPDDLFVVADSDAKAALYPSNIPAEQSLAAESQQIDEMVTQELENGGYTWEDPLVITNPYQNAPLTGLILYESEEPCRLRVTVKGKTEGASLTGELPAASSHRVPVVGLYPGKTTKILLEELDEEGNTLRKQKIPMEAEPLPPALKGMVKAVETSGTSAYGLTAVYGQGCSLPFAYDCNGDIRWYLANKVGNYGLYPLDGGHLLAQDTTGYSYSPEKPQSTGLYELDLLGRYVRMFYVANGTHHEVIEKTPGGNLLLLTSSMKDHFEDEILEIDRQTGAVVNELELMDLFGDTYTDLIDWAHINTVSWQEDHNTILISCRNLHSVIKIGWDTHEIQWILSNPLFWEGTPFEKYVLTPEDSFHWAYHQHTAYQLTEDLDGSPETVELTLFDNHIKKYRPVEFYDGLKGSFAMVFSVNEKEGTVNLVKEFPVLRSVITSNVVYEADEGRLFAMCGYINKGAWNGRRGMNYEFDYETGEVLNQYSIKKTFYRSCGLTLNLEDLASPLTVEEDFLKGTLKQAVPVTGEITETPEALTGEEELSLKRIGSVLYVSAPDHSISQVLLEGEEHRYVYDAASMVKYYDKYQAFTAPLPIPLSGLAPDTYEVLCVYQDRYLDTGRYVTVPES